MKDNTPLHTSNNLKHHKDNEQFRKHFSKDVDTVFNTIPCNLFEIEYLFALSDTSHLFPESFVER